MSDPVKGATLGLLIKLGSIAVHADEMLSLDGHAFDRAAIDQLLKDPEVVEWTAQMTRKGFLPVKRHNLVKPPTAKRR